MNINQMANDLKDIPQAKLIQYVQDPNSVVPQFLALAEIQRRKTLERGAGAGQAPQSTVAQDIMAQAAPQPMAPEQAQGLQALQRPQGVAALPSGMGEQAFAGGGIIAFAKGDEVEDPYAALSFTEKLKRLREAENEDTAPESSLFKRGIPMFGGFQKNLESYAPIKAVSADADAQPGGFYGGKASGVKPDALGRYVANTEPTTPNAPSAPSAPKPRVTSTQAAKELSIPQATEKSDIYGKYEKMFNEQAASAAAQREQDKWLRVVEAGLGMMGGTSPYALTNIGQGSMGAVKGYAQDLAAQRKEDRQNVMDLMNLGMKKEEAEREARKLSMQEKYYGSAGEKDLAMADFYRNKGVLGTAGASTKMDIAELNAIKSAFATLQKSATSMGSPNYGKSPEELWSMAERMVKGGGGGAPVQSTISYSDFASSLKK